MYHTLIENSPVKNFDIVLSTGSRTNEDYTTVTSDGAWVLDGTSGTSDRTLFENATSDGAWYVRQLDELLQQKVPNQTFQDALFNSIAEMPDIIEEEMTFTPANEPGNADVSQSVSPLDLPASTVAGVKWTETRLEVLSLADAIAVIETENGVDTYLHGDPEQFDKLSRQAMSEYREEHPEATADEVRANTRGAVENVRILREMPGGYWSAGVNPVAARKAVTGEYDVKEVESVAMFTDGFTKAVDLFGLYDSWADVVDDLKKRSLSEVVTELRSVEREDKEMREVMRLKPHDDIGGIHLDFTN